MKSSQVWWLVSGISATFIYVVFYRFSRTDVLAKDTRVLLLFAGLLCIAVFALSLFQSLQSLPWSARIRNGITNFLLFVVALMFSLIILEAGFTFFERSHSVGYSLAAQSWFKNHWNLNSEGFREREWNQSDLIDKKKIVLIGDSFAAGHGIENPEDRFSNLLQKGLPEAWIVLNYGRNGADSRAQYKTLTNLKFEPDLLILSYFGNDIMEAADAAGHSPAVIKPYTDLSPTFASIVKNSYFLDYIHWILPRTDLKNWWEYYQEVYRDPKILDLHRKDLNAFVNYARDRKIEMVVVLFPYLHDLEKSDIYVPFVKGHFSAQGIAVLNVGEFVGDLPLNERIVNTNDVHPSKVVHKRVADHLQPMINQAIQFDK